MKTKIMVYLQNTTREYVSPFPLKEVIKAWESTESFLIYDDKHYISIVKMNASIVEFTEVEG